MDKGIWYIQGTMANYEVSLRDGQYYIRYCAEKLKNGALQPFISDRDPEKEALRISGGFVLKTGLIGVVIGSGCIKLIELLKKQKHENGGDIIIFEADEILFNELSSIRKGFYDDVLVVTKASIDKLSNFVGQCTLESMLGYRILPHARSYQLCPEIYKTMEEKFKSLFSIRFSDLLTRIEFEARWVLNGLLNIQYLIQGTPVKRFFNLGQGENALLVSSGPSLRDSLPWLKENQHLYFIACVDSAYRVLHRFGIKPHLIFSLDSQIYTYKHFQGLPLGEKGQYPILYADLVSNPVIVRNWQGSIVFGMTAHYTDTHREVTPGCDYIEEEFLSQPCGDLQSGGSVATSLFDLLRNMDFNSITLVGQDLAFTNREIHCTGTHHTDIWISKNLNRLESLENINNRVLKKRHIVMGKSIRGGELPEDYIFSIYRRWFEEAIATVPVKVMNAGSDGAYIEGTQPMIVPEKNLSGKFIEKLSKAIFEDSRSIVKSEYLKIFYTRVVCQNLSDHDNGFSNMGFMNRIGKKYYIKHLRTQMRKEEDQPENKIFLQLMNKEKQIFWKILQKRIQSSKTF